MLALQTLIYRYLVLLRTWKYRCLAGGLVVPQSAWFSLPWDCLFRVRSPRHCPRLGVIGRSSGVLSGVLSVSRWYRESIKAASKRCQSDAVEPEVRCCAGLALAVTGRYRPATRSGTRAPVSAESEAAPCRAGAVAGPGRGRGAERP
jgi:hypothetical protein